MDLVPPPILIETSDTVPNINLRIFWQLPHQYREPRDIYEIRDFITFKHVIRCPHIYCPIIRPFNRISGEVVIEALDSPEMGLVE